MRSATVATATSAATTHMEAAGKERKRERERYREWKAGSKTHTRRPTLGIFNTFNEKSTRHQHL